MRIDLRSDTLTQPSPDMRKAMLEAELGDDVYGEDPTVNHLQERVARMLGKEAALFMPSGSMGNCVCLLSQVAPGHEIICEAKSHIINYELASLAVFGGLLPRVIPGVNGRMDPDDIVRAVQPKTYYASQTGLIALENTHNMAGGTVLEPEYMAQIREIAHRYNLPVHLDGARMFNAAAYLGVPVVELARYADSVMFCFSKGLAAPVGSIVAGSAEFITRARVHRKRLGGGMRQVGMLAAAAMVALDTVPPLLPADHEKIQRYAGFLSAYDFIRFDPATVQTNILVFQVNHPQRTAADLGGYLAERGILCHVFGDNIRFVTYRDITFEMVEESLEIIRDIFRHYF
ncbi:MAG: aminotransferase class I/II-fold pyridoxal phosphate-dependent enzyme [Acidobacteria bacterium]|nr:aminotransferase class I/II-fold pyridoxal phosphate-dependent enzyme [Acidobacteriota bacterium]